MEMIKNSFNWVEIPALDFERAKKFYSTIYDFEMPEMMLEEIQMGFLLMEQGGDVGGAICKGKSYAPSQDSRGPKVYLNGGKDLSVVLDRIEGAGGKVVLGKTLIRKDIGYFAIFVDSEGNELYLHSMG